MRALPFKPAGGPAVPRPLTQGPLDRLEDQQSPDPLLRDRLEDLQDLQSPDPLLEAYFKSSRGELVSNEHVKLGGELFCFTLGFRGGLLVILPMLLLL